MAVTTPTTNCRPWLRALGRDGLPERIDAAGCAYSHVGTFKHDFFAATALYQGPSGKIVLKVGRVAPLLGIPLDWIGAFLAKRESRLFRLLSSVDGIPRLVGRWGRTGIIHEFVEGEPLAKDTPLSDDFFPRLRAMLVEIHARGMAYVDLEKRENILVGTDGRPYLIDFQISWHLPPNRLGDTWIARWVLSVLQSADDYHLLKHWRRLRPDQLGPEQIARSHRPPFWIAWHRHLFRPLTMLRRRVLVLLGERSSHKTRSPG